MTALVGAARFSAANARVRALFPQLIPPDQWAELIDAPDLPTLLLLLESTSYGPLLPLSAGPLDIVQAERALARRLAEAARPPFTLLQGGPRKLLEWHWRRFEVDNLKTLLRGVHHRATSGQVQAALHALGPPSALPWSDLATASSVPELVERLAATWYGRILHPVLDQYRRQQSVFPLEVALDLGYYAELLGRIANLQGADRADASDFLGAWVDTQNLLWAYRYRLYAELSPEEILNYTLQRNLRVNADVVRRIALGTPLLEVVRNVWHGRLTGLDALADLPARAALPRLELAFQRHFFALAQRARTQFPLRLAVILAYEFLLEYEIRDLVAVIEGKAVGWPGARIQAYLIGERRV